MDTTIVPDKLVLVDGILSGFGIHCFMNAAEWVQGCYRWIRKAWDGFGFGQGLFRWGLDCK